MGMLDGKQIRDGSIAAAKLASGILASLLRADGAVLLTGNLDANGNRVVGLAQPVNANDAARLADLNSIPWKQIVKAATTGNVSLTGQQTIDGVALVAGDRVLVWKQSAGAENGIYIVATGAWARAADADSAQELRGATVVVEQGTTLADKRIVQTSDNITLGTTALVWVDVGNGPASAYPTSPNKDMTASVTSADFQQACAVTIAGTPAQDSWVGVYINGLLVALGDGVRTKACYFSSDGGVAAKTIANIAAGDTLYWVGSVAGYHLAATDSVDLVYVTAS